MSKCTFVVSAFDRPDHLACLLYSLKVQTEKDFDVIVTDNGWTESRNFEVVAGLNDSRFQHVYANCQHCYESANKYALEAEGEYLCFPSDDDYYVPEFLERMLRPNVDLVYCNAIYDMRLDIPYGTLNVEPKSTLIDKAGFLVRRSKFQPFPWQECINTADGLMVERLAAHVSTRKVEGILWVHN